jgi:hypothetical protein
VGGPEATPRGPPSRQLSQPPPRRRPTADGAAAAAAPEHQQQQGQRTSGAQPQAQPLAQAAGAPKEEAQEQGPAQQAPAPEGSSPRPPPAQPPPPGQPGLRAPQELWLGVANSLRDEAPTCRGGQAKITLFAHVWVDNRTGLDLEFDDANKPLSFSLPCMSQFAQGAVKVPGARARGLASGGAAAVEAQGQRPPSGGGLPEPRRAGQQAPPALLNRQMRVQFRVAADAGGARSRRCEPVPVASGEAKVDVALRGARGRAHKHAFDDERGAEPSTVLARVGGAAWQRRPTLAAASPAASSGRGCAGGSPADRWPAGPCLLPS